MSEGTNHSTGLEIAVIGMAGRFPGATSIGEYWSNLVAGKETLSALDDDHLREQGVEESVLYDSNYVKVGGLLSDSDHFDAGFFEFSPREAEILDPQQRLFLECAWEALETAGYDSNRYPHPIGVFGGAGMNGYLLNLYSNPNIRTSTSPYELYVGNDKDFLTTRVSYKLNLRGPSMSIQTACSSSLVAVHTACQALISGECDMALAGGVAVSKQIGYRVQEGGIYSPDGHCRPFDAKANGTVGGNGVGLVVLKRLDDALADGDSIDAVIKGSAVTNDGAHKVSYTAPQVDSQATVIRNALAIAEVDAGTITYIEAHGTGTLMGDPIELAALTQAFRTHTDRRQFCALGSVKSNIGHLDAAAGIAGLIKTILALKHQQIPASMHFENPNPAIDFESSPFVVNARLTDWSALALPRRAGVSSFGIGGTNVHVILEEAPKESERPLIELPVILPLSAKSGSALQEKISQLAEHLQDEQAARLEDVAHTLQEGRRAFAHRTHVVASSVAQAIYRLSASPKCLQAAENPSLVLLFPGQGNQRPNVEESWTNIDPAFKESYDLCQGEIARLHSREGGNVESECLALFSREYALAKLALSWGLKPTGLLGHSFGEVVAACVAGVFDLETAVRFVSLRGKLMDATAPGAMLVAQLTAEAASSYVGESISLAAHNAPKWVSFSGAPAAIDALQARLKNDGVGSRGLEANRAFHSPSMDSVADSVTEMLFSMTLKEPNIPFISGVSGEWISNEDAIDPEYWGHQLRQPVRFSTGVETVRKLPNVVFLELGPSVILANLVAEHGEAHTIAFETKACAGKLWEAGLAIDWSSTRSGSVIPKRIPLPTYPFERSRYWVCPDTSFKQVGPSAEVQAIDDWFYYPTWKRSISVANPLVPAERQRWLVFLGEGSMGESLSEEIEQSGQDVFRVKTGDGFESTGFRKFAVIPSNPESLAALFQDLGQRETLPHQVVLFWPHPQDLQKLLKELAEHVPGEIQISVIIDSALDVIGSEPSSNDPQAAMRGLCLVAGQEYPQLGCRLVDIDTSTSATLLWNELRAKSPPMTIAYRGGLRWEYDYAPLALAEGRSLTDRTAIRDGEAYVVIGDLSSELGKTWADALLSLPNTSLSLINTNPDADFGLVGVRPWITAVDGADQVALKEAFQAATEANGVPHGVFVCSPTTNEKSAGPLTLLTQDHWHYNQTTKVSLIKAIADVIEQVSPAFVCVQSSMSAVLGGIGLGAYAAANAQLDRVIARLGNVSSVTWMSIDWDRISDGGADTLGGDELALTPQQAWEATQRLVDHGISGIFVVSPTSLQPRLSQWVRSSPSGIGDQSGTSHSRPELLNDYTAARNDVERTIVEIWEEMLGIQGIGVDDNFFALGGHSLLAIQIIGRLREAFPVEIELRHLVTDNPTPATIARVIEPELPQPDQLDEMANLLEEIQSLSPEEARDQLRESSS